ncbi:MAG TPA: PKD domain-containing protein, partial [Bacteroidia bacterium]|nr:PKD domain-containing protein [Bacteroidia bacterium]
TNNADSSFTSVWDYGDSSPLNTIDGTHTHTYALAGTYNACNYITTSCGTDTICMSVTVCGSAATSAGYSSTTMGAMAMFTDASTNATSWYWDFGDSNTSTSQSPSHTYAASGTYYVCLTAYNGICDTATFCDSVTICLPASATYTFFDSSGTVQFTDSSVNVDTWVWDFGDASPPDSNQNPVHTYTVNGTYTVCLVASSCSADTTCNTITVCPEALTAAFMSSDSGTTAMFTDMSATATSWLWDFGDGNFSTSQNPTNVYANTGLYTVCLTTWNICGDSAMSCDTILLIITGQEALNANVNIGVYPNPMNDATTITVTSAEHSGNYVFEMYDAAGKLVRTQNGAFNQSMNVNRGDLSNGMYFYKIKTNNEVLGNGKIMLTN